ncbi:casein kinase 2 regulatory subunit [Sticta canariensis]|nr:casein kinase 2 regulatory subunit [Sticta canariensis]
MRPLTMGLNQEAAMLHGGEIFKDNQPEHEKEEPEERQAKDKATQVDRPSMTQALRTPSAQANHDASARLPIESDKDASVPSSNVSVIAVSERSESYRISGDDADRSATASPPSELDYAANMLRSPVTYQWNDSGDDDDDPFFDEDLYLWSSQRRPSSPSRSMKSVSIGNKRHQHVIPRRFTSSRGNEYFCEIDEDYLTDRFNLTGLNVDVQYYQYALDLVTDVFDLDCEDEMREQIEKSARHLYGLVHARYITTTRGLAKMLEKYKKADFGKCPRVMCAAHPLLPTGLSDNAHTQSVKLYCGKCEDLYNPKSSRHANIDGAYFGTSFQNILFQVYPALIPEKTIRRYEPKVFGFKVHAAAALERWQSARREEMQTRLKEVGFGAVFKEDTESAGEDVMEEEEDDVEGGDGLAE